MKSTELQVLWNDWLGTSDKLTRILHEQTVALTLRDVARVERIQPELDGLMEKMHEIDGRAATCAKELAEGLETEPNLRGLVQVLEKTEAQQVQALANKVIVQARKVNELVEKNKTLIGNELVYVNGSLTLIAKAVQKNERPMAKMPTRAAVLIDQAA